MLHHVEQLVPAVLRLQWLARLLQHKGAISQNWGVKRDGQGDPGWNSGATNSNSAAPSSPLLITLADLLAAGKLHAASEPALGRVFLQFGACLERALAVACADTADTVKTSNAAARTANDCAGTSNAARTSSAASEGGSSLAQHAAAARRDLTAALEASNPARSGCAQGLAVRSYLHACQQLLTSPSIVAAVAVQRSTQDNLPGCTEWVPNRDLEVTLEGPPSVGCWNPMCTNLSGVAEDALILQRCIGCGVAKYCSEACQEEAWGVLHSSACASMKTSGKENAWQQGQQLRQQEQEQQLQQEQEQQCRVSAHLVTVLQRISLRCGSVRAGCMPCC